MYRHPGAHNSRPGYQRVEAHPVTATVGQSCRNGEGVAASGRCDCGGAYFIGVTSFNPCALGGDRGLGLAMLRTSDATIPGALRPEQWHRSQSQTSSRYKVYDDGGLVNTIRPPTRGSGQQGRVRNSGRISRCEISGGGPWQNPAPNQPIRGNAFTAINTRIRCRKHSLQCNMATQGARKYHAAARATLVSLIIAGH